MELSVQVPAWKHGPILERKERISGQKLNVLAHRVPRLGIAQAGQKGF